MGYTDAEHKDMAADSTEMVWGNKKAAADNDMAPVHGSRLCIHDRKDRTREKPPLKILIPFTIFLYARYSVRTPGKKRCRLSSGIFFTPSRQLHGRQSGAGTAAFLLFLPQRPEHSA